MNAKRKLIKETLHLFLQPRFSSKTYVDMVTVDRKLRIS